MSVPGVELVGRQNACRVDLENRSRDWIVNLDDLNVHFGDAPPCVRKEHVEFWSSRDFPPHLESPGGNVGLNPTRSGFLASARAPLTAYLLDRFVTVSPYTMRRRIASGRERASG